MAEPRPVLLEVPDQLVGPRVILRPWRDDDAPALFGLVERSRAHLERWMAMPTTTRSVDDARASVRRLAARWILREDLVMAIFDRAGALLGGVGLHPRDWSVPSFEIGYWIGAPFEGQGYVSEAVTLVTRLAFDVLRANRIYILCDAENYRSANVARRCLYTLEGTHRRDARAPDGSLRDTLCFSHIREDP